MGGAVLKALSPVGGGCNINCVLKGSRWELRERVDPYGWEASQNRWYWNWALGFSK